MIKTVEKPWGREEWIEVNDAFATKFLYITAGCRLSLQYHEVKTEMLYLIYGPLLYRYGTEDKVLMYPGEMIYIPAGIEHRFCAPPDKNVLLFEVSSPELDDIVRIDDDYDRPVLEGTIQ
jgi:mannose-6-phosphate isomerase-like protein (cupin superfamily)